VDGKRRSRKKYIALAIGGGLVVLAVVVVLFVIRPFGGAAKNANRYLTEQVSRGDLEKSISTSGSLSAGKTVTVTPGVSGVVTEVLVKVGDTVEKGDVLFEVDDDKAQAEVDSAAGQLRTAKLQLSAARAALKAAKATPIQTAKEILKQQTGSVSSGSSSGSGSSSSGGSNALSTLLGGSTTTSKPTAAEKKAAKAQEKQSRAAKKSQIDQAEVQVASAQSSLSTAQDVYNDARDLRDKAQASAPMSGVVAAVNLKVDDEVSASTSSGSSSSSSALSSTAANSLSSALGSTKTSSSTDSAATTGVELVKFDRKMTVQVQATEAEVDSLQAGMKCVLSFDAFDDLEAEGAITEISPVGTTSGGLVTFPVIIEMKDPDARLKPGMNVATKIVLAEEKDVLLVPNTAIGGDAQSGWTVQVASADGSDKTQAVPVKLGVANDTYTVVTEGISEGTVVVTGVINPSQDQGSSTNMMMGDGMGGGMGGMGRGSGSGGGGAPGTTSGGSGTRGGSGSGGFPPAPSGGN
jgi:multidrug efflux pump subunit AcrA (membrane-fusion protein)